MKNCNQALVELLATNNFMMADLYTITLTDGTNYFFTNYDIDLNWAGNTYQKAGLLFKRTGTRLTTGIEVDTLNITINQQDNKIINQLYYNDLYAGRHITPEVKAQILTHCTGYIPTSANIADALLVPNITIKRAYDIIATVDTLPKIQNLSADVEKQINVDLGYPTTGTARGIILGSYFGSWVTKIVDDGSGSYVESWLENTFLRLFGYSRGFSPRETYIPYCAGVDLQAGTGLVESLRNYLATLQNVTPTTATTITTNNFWAYIANGKLDGATLKLERLFFTDPLTPVDSFWIFSGRVSDCELTRSEAKISVKSDLELLNIQMPRNIFQPSCLHALYDSGCGVAKTGFTGTVTSVDNGITFGISVSKADKFFEEGFVEFTSGANTGAKRTIKTHASNKITITRGLTGTISVGDTFKLYAGCDRTQATCQTKFNNLPNFRAFPYVPQPETVR